MFSAWRALGPGQRIAAAGDKWRTTTLKGHPFMPKNIGSDMSSAWSRVRQLGSQALAAGQELGAQVLSEGQRIAEQAAAARQAREQEDRVQEAAAWFRQNVHPAFTAYRGHKQAEPLMAGMEAAVQQFFVQHGRAPDSDAFDGMIKAQLLVIQAPEKRASIDLIRRETIHGESTSGAEARDGVVADRQRLAQAAEGLIKALREHGGGVSTSRRWLTLLSGLEKRFETMKGEPVELHVAPRAPSYLTRQEDLASATPAEVERCYQDLNRGLNRYSATLRAWKRQTRLEGAQSHAKALADVIDVALLARRHGGLAVDSPVSSAMKRACRELEGYEGQSYVRIESGPEILRIGLVTNEMQVVRRARVIKPYAPGSWRGSLDRYSAAAVLRATDDYVDRYGQAIRDEFEKRTEFVQCRDGIRPKAIGVKVVAASKDELELEVDIAACNRNGAVPGGARTTLPVKLRGAALDNFGMLAELHRRKEPEAKPSTLVIDR